MGLKQDIVVVNEYTIKSKDKKGGSRGGTPGAYVARYMARIGATEDLTPIRLTDNEKYIQRYMARNSATERLSTIPDIKQAMREAQGLGGVAFGQFGSQDLGDISMSHRKVKQISKEIQTEFDSGKTCLKTILSFDEEYLRRVGVISEDFKCKNRGDYRGNIDQMKLRLAIMNGMKKLGRRFDDLLWTGVIQVDTEHVHCHLCMVDRGVGRLTEDGTQKGKLSAKEMVTLRRGIDNSLDEMNPILMMASNVTLDRRNAKCFIKKYTHKTMAENGIPQFLLACLPDNKNWWRASTNRAEMKKANTIVREYVIQVLSEPNSGYTEALRDIDSYARQRFEREGLTDKDYRHLVKNGQERLIDDCVNSVYSVLKSIPDSSLDVETPLMNVMSMDYYSMASELKSDPMVEFGFKLRSYASRLSHHKDERNKYRYQRKQYEEAFLDEPSNVSIDSHVLHDFYAIEEEYNAKVLCKYQHFLSFLPSKESYVDDFQQVISYRNKITDLKSMCEDKDMKRMTPDVAEDYGLKVYNNHGGRFVKNSIKILENRLEKMTMTYGALVDDFCSKLADYGLTLDTETDEYKVSTKKPYEFDEVKALDLHHLGYDFPYDTPLSQENADAFIAIAMRRYEAFLKAKDYLEKTNQSDYIQDLPEKDIDVMKAMADALQVKPVLPSVKAQGSTEKRRTSTIRLDANYTADLKLAVKATVQSTQLGIDS